MPKLKIAEFINCIAPDEVSDRLDPDEAAHNELDLPSAIHPLNFPNGVDIF